MSDLTQENMQMGPTVLAQIFMWFQRIIAAYCLLFGILYWVRIIGLYEGPLWRFDLMPLHWQVATVTLAVLFPFAAIGLWMLASWGPVIWFICAATETIMYAGFPDLFGYRPTIVLSHAVVAGMYCLFRALLYWQKRRAEKYS